MTFLKYYETSPSSDERAHSLSVTSTNHVYFTFSSKFELDKMYWYTAEVAIDGTHSNLYGFGFGL